MNEPGRKDVAMRTTRTRVVLCGGSSGNHVLAADLGRRAEFEVRLVTGQPEAWSRDITCVEQRNWCDSLPFFLPSRTERYSGRVSQVFGWDRVEEALTGADIVVLTCPVHAHRELLARILPALDPSRDVVLGSLYAQGGFDWTLRALVAELGISLERVALFGLKRFPYLCKKSEYGEAVRLYGRFPRIVAAVQADSEALRSRGAEALQRLFRKPLKLLPSFLPCTLNVSNQVLHPAITWSLFRDFEPGQYWPRVPRFYGECNPVAGREIRELTHDIRGLARQLEPIVGYPVASLLGADPSARLALRLWGLLPEGDLHDRVLAAGIRSNKRINQVLTPMVAAERGYQPDFRSRFWTDDLPHGLCVVLGLAAIVDQPVPAVARMIERQQRFMDKKYLEESVPDDPAAWGPDMSEANLPQHYGVTEPDDLRDFLRWGSGAQSTS